jgi:hypothetical protein
MNNLINFEQFNESILGSLLIGFISGWLIYKFLKGLEKDLLKRKEEKKVISTFLEMINIKEVVAVSEFNDRYFIRLANPDNKKVSLDLRVYKETKMLEIGVPSKFNKKFPLTSEQYSKFLSIVNRAE